MEAAPVEDQIELSGEPSGQDIILLPADRKAVCHRCVACAADSGLGDIHRSHVKAALGQLARLRARPSAKIERTARNESLRASLRGRLKSNRR